ncbi:MAG: SNF2-related protein [Verrucomicrobiota bacterium]
MTSANGPIGSAVLVKIDVPSIQVQDTLLPLTDLRGYFLRERAALWWVSNQSDDLLGLPYCAIQHLDYQIRTALRVIGPLRGRALLSDEVGLGKTIEAGLVLKEYLTRGMVKRFLVLTVPSLVDQWAEELSEKFNLAVRTTNEMVARNDLEGFWMEKGGVVASLHTLKQPAHLRVAQTVHWDLLIVDEAHYLRNRSSQAWQSMLCPANSSGRPWILPPGRAGCSAALSASWARSWPRSGSAKNAICSVSWSGLTDTLRPMRLN